MKPLYLFLLLFTQLQVFAQQSRIHGVVSILNSQTETGKRIFVSNAQVEDDFGKAQPTLTDANGKFTLIYVGIGEKTTVTFQVKKTNLEVVNTDALKAIAGQFDEIKISMAEKDKIAEYRRRIYNVGKTEAEKKLELLVLKKTKELALLQVNNEANKSKIQQLNKDLQELDKMRKSIEEQAQDLARKYSPVNLDDASPLFRQAFQLFQNGHLDSALIVLSRTNLDLMVVNISKEQSRIKNARQDLDSMEVVLQQRKTEATETIRLKADLFKARFETDSAEHYYKLLIRLDSTNISSLYAYADYSYWSHQFNKALQFYYKILTLVNEGANTNNAIAALVRFEIGQIHAGMNNFAEAETQLTLAMHTFTELARVNAPEYEPDLAKVKSKLGSLYLLKKDFATAEEFIREALQIRRRLEKNDTLTYRPQIAYTLNNLGLLYKERNNFKLAEANFLEAEQIFKPLARENRPQYAADLAGIQGQLANLYVNTKNYTRSEELFKNSLEIYKQLEERNSVKYEHPIAKTLNNLGILYRKMNDSVRAEASFVQAEQIFNRLSKKEPEIYEPDWAAVLKNLSDEYTSKGDITRAKGMLLKALDIYDRLSARYPLTYQFSLVQTYVSLGNLYNKSGDFSMAQKTYKKALDIAGVLAKDDPDVYSPAVARIQTNLGYLLLTMNHYPEAEPYLTKAFTGFSNLLTDSTKFYAENLEGIMSNLSFIYVTMLDTMTAYPSKMAIQQKLIGLLETGRKKIGLPEDVLSELASTYGDLSWSQLCTRQFKQAELSAQKGLSIDSNLNKIRSNLAHALLLQGRFDDAKKIYAKFKLLETEQGSSLAELCANDLERLVEEGISHRDMVKARDFLRN